MTLPRAVSAGLGVAIVVLGFGPRNERALFVLDQPPAAFAALTPTPNPVYPFFYGVAGQRSPGGGGRGSVFRPLVLPPAGMTSASALSPASLGAGSLPLPTAPLDFNTFGPVVGDNLGAAVPGVDGLPPLAGGPGTQVTPPGGGGGTPTPTPGTSPTPSPTPTPGASPTPTPTPGSSPTPTPTPGSSPTPTPTPGSTPTPTPTPVPTDTPTPTPTPSAPSVPEPNTWLMLIAGFGVIGYRLRRSRLRAQLHNGDGAIPTS